MRSQIVTTSKRNIRYLPYMGSKGMELGLYEKRPFASQPSWAKRMIVLHDAIGPFRLTYLGAIRSAADMRVSKVADQRPTGWRSRT